jgi:mono/diheme cytochrome c family protein
VKITKINLLWVTALAAAITYLAICSVRVTDAQVGNQSVRNDAGARAGFLEAYKVFMHPRCVNCHPAGDAPLQGEDSHPHSLFRLRRGADGNGVYALKCSNCHQAQNQPGPNMPPGAPYPLKYGVEDPAHRAEPRWHLPPAATPMVFEKRTPGQLCRQLLDQKQNGGLSPEQLVDHVSHDPLVLWGWNPGEGRSTPPLMHDEFVSKVKEWLDNGGSCPK